MVPYVPGMSSIVVWIFPVHYQYGTRKSGWKPWSGDGMFPLIRL